MLPQNSLKDPSLYGRVSNFLKWFVKSVHSKHLAKSFYNLEHIKSNKGSFYAKNEYSQVVILYQKNSCLNLYLFVLCAHAKLEGNETSLRDNVKSKFRTSEVVKMCYLGLRTPDILPYFRKKYSKTKRILRT